MKLDEGNQYFSLLTHSKCVGEKNMQELAAQELLKKTKLSLVDAARLVLELSESLDGLADWTLLRRAIVLGAQQIKLELHTVSFSEALEWTLAQKRHRSPRTLQDIRQTMQSLMKIDSSLSREPIRSMTTARCRQLLDQAYGHAPSRWIKARANLSGVFTMALQQGWCAGNPVGSISSPELQEREIKPLSLGEIKHLFHTAQHQEHRCCLPALALMLYAGVRPDELRRLTWDDIDWEERQLYMAPRHSKTGGGRHVPLALPLLNLLRRHQSVCSICPPHWIKRWQYLRQAAGFSHWVPDILRHSYASYHAKMYRDLPRLQLAMGHRDCQLLLTRYINLRGITMQSAKAFWRGSFLEEAREGDL